MANLELRAQRRAVVGKKVRFLRRQGLLPASLYGPGVESVALQLPARETEAALRRIGPSTLVPLIVDGEVPRRVLIRQVQRHPTGEQALHLDLFALAMNEPIRSPVPLHFVGEAPAVAELDGTIVHELDTVELESLPDDLPTRLDIDLSVLRELHSAIHVRDLAVPRGVTVLTTEDATIVSVQPPRVEVEAVEEAAAEAPEAEAPAAAESGAPEEETA